MDLELKDKVALVTGSSRGIGKRIAAALAAEGARLCICARGADALAEAAAELASGGSEVEATAQDVTTPEGASAVVEAAQERFGRLDVLVNNVGGSKWTPFVEIDDEEWNTIVNWSFLSAVRVSRAAIPAMEAGGGGSIVNIASIFGRETGGPVSYNAAKAAMISLGANLAIENGQKEHPRQYRSSGLHSLSRGELGAADEGKSSANPSLYRRQYTLWPLWHPGGSRRCGDLFGVRPGEMGDRCLHQCRWGTIQV